MSPVVLRTTGEALRARIRNERGWFAKRILGQRLWRKQYEMEDAVFRGPKMQTEVSGCVSSTKTYGAAMLALQWLCGHRPSRVLSLAPSFRQVDSNIWGYIKELWAAAADNGTPLGDTDDIFREPRIDFSCKPGCARDHVHVSKWYYQGFSTDDPGNVHGIHGPNDLLILDDAQGISQELLDELENMKAGGNTRVLMLYNKMRLTGPTYAATHKERNLWNHVSISYDDLKKARCAGHKLEGALSADTVGAWRAKYGVPSPFFQVKVLNRHPAAEADALIPLDWIEQAFDRKVPATGPLVLGGDVAGEGDDMNALAPMRGLTVGRIEEWQEPDTMITVGRFVAEAKAEEHHEPGQAPRSRAFLYIDSCGLGGPMVNRIAEQDHRVESHEAHCPYCAEHVKVAGINGAETATGRAEHGGVMRDASEVFKNLRAQVYWSLREALNPVNKELISLTRDDDLAAQLSCIKFRAGSDGRIEVEPKIGLSVRRGGSSGWGIKRRLGFSPDKADAVAYANWGRLRTVQGEFLSEGAPMPSALPAEAKFMTAEDRSHPDERGPALEEIGEGLETL